MAVSIGRGEEIEREERGTDSPLPRGVHISKPPTKTA
jgi:hypothetical protein